MTIHFAASEPEAFVSSGNAWTTSSSYYRSGKGRGAMRCGSTQPITFKPPSGFGPRVVLGMRGRFDSISFTDDEWVEFYAGGTAYLRVRVDNSLSNCVVQSLQSSSWTTIATFSAAFTTGALLETVIDVTINSSTGSVSITQGGVTKLSATNVNTQGDNPGTTFDEVRLVYGAASYWANEIILADEDTTGMSVYTLYPASAGGLTEWDGDYTNIADGSTTASSILSSSAGEQFVFAHPESYAGGETIKAVILSARAAADGAGPTRIKALQRNAGTVYEGASAGVSTLGAHVFVMPTAPDGGAWTTAKINGSQFGWKSGS